MRALFLTSAAALAFAGSAFAQTATPNVGNVPANTPEPAQAAAADNTSAAAVDEAAPGEIIVTATRRAERLADVPIAVSAVTAESLQNSGATDIRALNQLSPSLLVSSTSSEAGGGVARIRGIGTVGDNPGLESSVAVFIDGVYRSRSGVGLTELGDVERIEVLRGPQGTLFGRNASAGLINIVTAAPKFDTGGYAEATYGNYDNLRLAGGITGGLTDRLAVRLDGVYSKRDGFLTDVISGRDLNNRDRYLVRGQLLFDATDDISIRIIGDYADRNEECCAATYLPFTATRKDAAGNVVNIPNPIVGLIRSLGGVITDDTYARRTSVTPGRDYRSDVTDWGVSGEVNWNLGAASLTSITAYRDWFLRRGQDADFNNLDILQRDGWRQRFSTFTQEVRLQGEAFDDRLDWLVGAYYADEKLNLTDNLKYGADYDRFATGVVGLSVPGFPGFGALQPFARAALTQQLVAAGQPLPVAQGIATQVASQVQNLPALAGTGIVEDRYRQKSRNYAFFTHNVLDITERLSLTLGARYTNERKDLTVNLTDNNAGCRSILGSIGALRASAATPGNPLAAVQGGLANTLQGLAALPCVIPAIGAPGSTFTQANRRDESEWTGTAVLSFKPTDRLLTYASYSKGYKAGGFNLDRSALVLGAPNTDALEFDAELVDAVEIGAKLDLRQFKLNVAAFYSVFGQFQLNTFNGVNFEVTNIQSCRDDLNGADRDFNYAATPGNPAVTNAAATGRCDADNLRGGVVSKGVEVEAALFPTEDLSVNLGLTYADTKYRENLVGVDGRPLTPVLFNIPGQRVSNAAQYVVTAGFGYNPEIGDTGMRGLFYVDSRLQSKIGTGSDLFPEKNQQAFFVMNARIGLQGPERRWSIEFWAQNLTNEDYQQVGFNAPLQGGGTVEQVRRAPAGSVTQTQLFGTFPAEPRTYGVTVRTRF